MYVRLSFACLILGASVLAQQPQPKSDRDKAGLRGPVKSIIVAYSSHSSPDWSEQSTTMTTYDPSGRILGVRRGKTKIDYNYDWANRLVEIRSGGIVDVRYAYDDEGHKSEFRTYPPLSLHAPPNAGYQANWEDTDMGFASSTSMGSYTIETDYNQQGVASGGKFYDASGTLVGHVVRTFNSDGRPTSDEQFADSLQLDKTFSEKLRTFLNPVQLEAVATSSAADHHMTMSYSYDDQGRETERRKSESENEEVITTRYNEYGDKISQRTTMVGTPLAGQKYEITEAGVMIPDGPPQRAGQLEFWEESQYSYTYDSYGNWTEQKTSYRSSPDDQFGPGHVIARKLTYY